MIEFELTKSELIPHIGLKSFSTMRVGGNAQYFFEVGDVEELGYIVGRCRDYGIPVYVLGNGSNTLFSDYGFEGAVLHLGERFSFSAREGSLLRVESGKKLPALCGELRRAGLSGLEFACGIPASVGGGTVMNCGAFGGEIGDRILSVEFWAGKKYVLLGRECEFGYRDSFFRRNPECIVTAVKFRLEPSTPERVGRRMSEIAALRRERQGVTLPSLGSIFLKADGIPAAKLIDSCGLKGMRVGGAAVSEKHAGYIVNLGGATSENILELIRRIKSTVYEKYGIILHEEIRRV